MKFTRLETDRLILQPLQNTDAIALNQLINKNHDLLKEDFPITLMNNDSLRKTKIYIRQKWTQWQEDTHYSFGIWEQTSNKLIGHFTIKSLDYSIPKCELGYWLDEDYYGKGLMTEAVNIILVFCNSQLDMRKIFLRTMTTNIASQKVAEKCGFTKEGHLQKEHRTGNGDVVDIFYYGKILKD